MIVLAVLPLAAFVLLLLHQEHGRDRFVVASVVWGVLVVILTEVLSVFDALTPTAVAIAWAVACGLLVALRPQRPQIRVPALEPFDAAILASIAIIVGLVGVVALLAPPNTYDVLEYHMPRVMQWARNGTVAHYPTHVLRELVFPPWNEFAILQFQLLTGGDRFANLVQWFAFGGCAIVSSLIARVVGGSRRAQLLAALLAVTIPMAILEASSAKNDVSAGLWGLCFVYSVLARRSALVSTAALGLAILTKSTMYLFLAPFAIWYAVDAVRNRRTVALATIALVPLVLNTGYFWRNLETFGHPLGPGREYRGPWVEASGDTGWLVAPPLTMEYGIRPTVGTVTSNAIRGASLHVVTGVPRVDARIERGVRKLHSVLGLDPDDPATTLYGSYRRYSGAGNEVFASNPVHLMLFLLAGVLLVRARNRRVVAYLGALAGAALLFVALVQWSPDQTRLHVPWFLLAAPMSGVGLVQLRFPVSVLVLLAALVPLLRADGRPLIGSGSVFIMARDDMRLTNPVLREAYRSAAPYLRDCSEVGIVVRALNDISYPLWTLLDARIAHVGVQNVSRQVARPLGPVEPCAVVTTSLPGGMPEVLEIDGRRYARRWMHSHLHVYQPTS